MINNHKDRFKVFNILIKNPLFKKVLEVKFFKRKKVKAWSKDLLTKILSIMIKKHKIKFDILNYIIYDFIIIQIIIKFYKN